MQWKITSLWRAITTVLAAGLFWWVAGFSEPGAAIAGMADIIEVRANPQADGTYSFSVTVRHDDTGWDHYADAWQVVGPDGAVLGTRVLLHPHVNEQPFTRSLGGVAIPAGVRRVTIPVVKQEKTA
jgi:hypothetical protein